MYTAFSFALPAALFDATFVLKAKLFAACFLDSLTEYLYDAHLADLGFQLLFTSQGLQLVFSGFSDKLLLFATTVLHRLLSFNPEAASVARFKDLLRRELLSWRTQQPYYHCSYFAALATETLTFPVEDSLSALGTITAEQLEGFLPRILFRSFGTALIMGNIDDKGAKLLLAEVDRAFPFTPLPVDMRVRKSIGEIPVQHLPFGGYLIDRMEPNEGDSNSACSFYFQLNSTDPVEYMKLELLSDVLEEVSLMLQPFIYNILNIAAFL